MGIFRGVLCCCALFVGYSALGFAWNNQVANTGGGAVYIQAKYNNGGGMTAYGGRVAVNPQACTGFIAWDVTGVVSPGNTVQLEAFTASTGGSSLGSGPTHTLISGNDTWCDTFTGSGWNIPQYTNYSKSFCITNSSPGPRYLAPYWQDVTLGLRFNLGDPFHNWLTGEWHCYTITNVNPFFIGYGDPNPGSDIPPVTQMAATNIYSSTAPGNSQAQSGNLPNSVGNANSPFGGTNASGSGSNLTEFQYNRGVEAQLAAQGVFNAAQNAYLSQIASNTARISTNSDYSAVLASIATNTAGARDALTNSAGANDTYATNAYQRATNVTLGALSNIIGSGLMSSYNFGGSGTGFANANYSQIISAPAAGFGLLSLTNAGVVVGTIDLGGAIDGSYFDNVFGGSGWRPWIRLLCTWALFLAAVIFVMREIRKGTLDTLMVTEFNVNANATGAFALIGGNVGLRAVMLIGLVAIVALIPSLVVVIAGSTLTLVNAFSASLPTNVVDAAAYGTSTSILGSVPALFKNIAYKINVMWPVVEAFIIGGNVLLVRFLLDPLCSVCALMMKLYGV